MNPQPEQIDHCKHVKANFHLFDEGGKDGPHHLVGFLQPAPMRRSKWAATQAAAQYDGKLKAKK